MSGDLCSIDKETGEAMVPLAWLGDVYMETGRLQAQWQAECDAERVLRLNAEEALRRERARGWWWWPARSSRGG